MYIEISLYIYIFFIILYSILLDYDAPLSEAGEYTPKYHLLRELLVRYNSVWHNLVLLLMQQFLAKNKMYAVFLLHQNRLAKNI